MHVNPVMPAMVATGGNDGLGGSGGLLALALLAGRGGLGFGNDGFRDGRGVKDDCVNNSTFTAGITGVTDAIQNTEVMAALGDLKAAVPLAEAQVQLALADSTGQIRGHLGAVENTLTQGQFAINQNVSNAIASSLASQNNILSTILTTGAANIAATKDAQFAITTATRDEGDKTRALVASYQDANTQRLLGERQDLINELQAEGRRRDDRHGIDITMIQNNNQQQLQAQQQQQQIANLVGCIHGINQNIQATNQAINIGGLQTANPTNTNTNVRA